MSDDPGLQSVDLVENGFGYGLVTFSIHLLYIKSIRSSHHMENATSYHTDLPPRPASGPEYNSHHKVDKDQLPYIHIPSSQGDILLQEPCPCPNPTRTPNT